MFFPNSDPLIKVALKQSYTTGIFEVMSKFLAMKSKIQTYASILKNLVSW